MGLALAGLRRLLQHKEQNVSKFWRALEATDRRSRVALMEPLEVLSSIEQPFSYTNSHPTAVVYRIEAALRRDVFVEDIALLPRVKEEVARELSEFMFGEFRRPLYEAVCLIRQGKSGDAIVKINEVLGSMFDPSMQHGSFEE